MGYVDINREIWAASIALAKCRVEVGNSLRSRHQDRGSVGNILADVQGCLGELIGLSYAESLGHACTHEILATRPSKSYDVSYSVNGAPLNIDVKCLFLSTIDGRAKRYLLIEKKAHDQHVVKNVNSYLPILTDVGSSRAFIGSLIQANDVDSWEVMNFRYGAPAYSISLVELAEKYFKYTLQEMSDMLKLYSEPEVLKRNIEIPLMNIPESLISNPSASCKEIVKRISWLIDSYSSI